MEGHRDQALTETIIGAAIEVHRSLGPGLLESVYEHCLCHELTAARLGVRRQAEIPVAYKGLRFDCGFRADLVANDSVVVELKTVEHLLPVHEAQLLSYLRLMGLRTGLLINFHVTVLKDGIKRRVL